MSDSDELPPGTGESELRGEILRLKKIVRVLMDRIEKHTNIQVSDFNSFRTSILLEDQVRRRTGELEAAMLGNERIRRALQEAEEQIRFFAFNDALTKIPNRRLFNDRLEMSMAGSRRSGKYGALMFLDLDKFKILNDTHGHDAGDLLLIEIAGRLARYIRKIDTVARLGGDEFVVLLNDLDFDREGARAQAATVAGNLRESLSLPCKLGFPKKGEGTEALVWSCTVSIGIAFSWVAKQAGKKF